MRGICSHVDAGITAKHQPERTGAFAMVGRIEALLSWTALLVRSTLAAASSARTGRIPCCGIHDARHVPRGRDLTCGRGGHRGAGCPARFDGSLIPNAWRRASKLGPDYEDRQHADP